MDVLECIYLLGIRSLYYLYYLYILYLVTDSDMSPPQLYRYMKRKDIPTAFWLFVLDKAIYWDQGPFEIKDDEEVSEEWVDVKPIYKELRSRLLHCFELNKYAIFIADGYRPQPNDDKAGYRNARNENENLLSPSDYIIQTLFGGVSPVIPLQSQEEEWGKE